MMEAGQKCAALFKQFEHLNMWIDDNPTERAWVPALQELRLQNRLPIMPISGALRRYSMEAAFSQHVEPLTEAFGTDGGAIMEEAEQEALDAWTEELQSNG